METSKIISFLGQHAARDKLIKVFHYGARIFIERAKERGDTQRVTQLESFRQSMGSARRVGRFFMSINLIPSIKEHLADRKMIKEDKLMWVMLLSAHVSDFFYYFFDNIPFLVDYGLFPLNKQFSDWCYDFVGSWSWMISVVVWIIHDLRELKKILNTPTRNLNQKESLERRENIKECILTLVSYFADLQLAIYFCFPNWKNNWSSKWVGVFGVINAVIGIYKRYK